MLAVDLVIAELAASEAALIGEVRELAADAHAYRELGQVSIADVARLTRLVESQAATIRTLRTELQRYTAAVIENAA